MEIPIWVLPNICNSLDDVLFEKKWWLFSHSEPGLMPWPIMVTHWHYLYLSIFVFFSERHVRCHQNDKESLTKKNIHPEEGGAMQDSEGKNWCCLLVNKSKCWQETHQHDSYTSECNPDPVGLGGTYTILSAKTCWSVAGTNITNLLSLAGIFQPVRVSEGKEETTTAFKH